MFDDEARTNPPAADNERPEEVIVDRTDDRARVIASGVIVIVAR